MEAILLDIVQPHERQQLHKERFEIRCLNTCAWLEDVPFKQNFRVSRAGFEKLYTELAPHISEGTTKYAISKQIKLLVTLRHLAQGSYQLSVGNEMHAAVSQSSVSKIIREVVDVMNQFFCSKYVVFPSFARMARIATTYHQMYGIPNVIGLIDGTHIKIAIGLTKDPAHPEHVYVNRKHFYSINATVVCDHEYKFTYVNARYPGSTNDSFVWRYSELREHLLQNYRDQSVWLLGDSGYPLEPVLLTPYAENDVDEVKQLFNEVHRKCRNGVERCIGVLKARWRCLKTERGLHYHPAVVGKIINACVALHNLCVDMDADYIDVVGEDDDIIPVPAQVFEENLFQAGTQVRNNVAAYLFQTMGNE